MEWLFLAGAIGSEVAGTLCLRVASAGRRAAYLPVAVGYVASFALLSLALHDGLGLGLAYGIWTAVGVVLTAAASHLLFAEPLTRVMALGMALIIAGVLLVELGR